MRYLELTDRQNEIVKLVLDGLSDIEIAKKLKLSNRTVGSHLHKIYKKLRVEGRRSLIVNHYKAEIKQIKRDATIQSSNNSESTCCT